MAKEISWQQLVNEADTDRKEDIVVYNFGGGRVKIKEKQDEPYAD